MARKTSTRRIDDDPNTSICKAQGISIMVQYNELRTATLRSVFAGVYACNFAAACLYFGHAYLDILASIIIMVTSACMLTISMQQPEQFMVYLEMSGKEIVFTWRMRMLADIIQILFLISCGIFGQIMAILTGVMLFVAFTLAQKRPDIFRELFRKHAGDPAVGDESVGDGTEESGMYHETSEDSARV